MRAVATVALIALCVAPPRVRAAQCFGVSTHQGNSGTISDDSSNALNDDYSQRTSTIQCTSQLAPWAFRRSFSGINQYDYDCTAPGISCYASNARCGWKIEVEKPGYIDLTFEHFHMGA